MLLGLLGVIVALAVVVIIVMVTGGDDEPVTATVGANATVAPSTTGVETATTPTTAATTTVVPTTEATTTAAPTTLPPLSGDTADVVAPGEPYGSSNSLSDVRFNQHEEGFTRVVFDFEDGDIPWWSVGYATGPFHATSDELIPVAGTDFLRIVLSAASYDLEAEEFRMTYEGPRRIDAGTNSVAEIVVISDFEGSMSWVIGVDGTKPFEVGTLTDPPRVYIDIQD